MLTDLSNENRSTKERLFRQFTDCSLGVFLRGELDDAIEMS